MYSKSNFLFDNTSKPLKLNPLSCFTIQCVEIDEQKGSLESKSCIEQQDTFPINREEDTLQESSMKGKICDTINKETIYTTLQIQETILNYDHIPNLGENPIYSWKGCLQTPPNRV